jgi:hypothetical protein
MTIESIKRVRKGARKRRAKRPGGVALAKIEPVRTKKGSPWSKTSAAITPAKDDGRLERLKQTSKGKTVVFGSWKTRAHALPLKETMSRVQSGNSALMRIRKTLTTSGVKLLRRKDVPLYRADPAHPDILIRELNGRSERVQLVGGEFKPAE